MSDIGFIYALINPSIPGLVKVGKTSRDPEERAKELSAATSVPTPFVVAFEISHNRFFDCEIYSLFRPRISSLRCGSSVASSQTASYIIDYSQETYDVEKAFNYVSTASVNVTFK